MAIDEEKQFLAFFAKEYRPLRRLGLLLTGNWGEAEELAQEAMARTFASWSHVRHNDKPEAFARKVLLNRHRSVLRRAVTANRYAATAHVAEHAMPAFSGDELVLWQALQELPAKQRGAVVLRFYIDLPEAEVARLLGAPKGSVKSWVHQGLERLRFRLGPPVRPDAVDRGYRPMTIEERVRALLAEAVENEPPVAADALDRVRRRRRPRPIVIGSAFIVLVLSALVATAGLREAGVRLSIRVQSPPGTTPTGTAGPPASATAQAPASTAGTRATSTMTSKPSTGSRPPIPKGWKAYTDAALNLTFHHPPDWTVDGRGGAVSVAPPASENPGTHESPPFGVMLQVADGYYVGLAEPGTARGSLSGGQDYLVWYPSLPRQPAQPHDAPGMYGAQYSVDWGRDCSGGNGSCPLRSVEVRALAGSEAQYERHRRTTERMIQTLAPVRPGAPSTGDRTRPACRPDQYELLWYGYGVRIHPTPRPVAAFEGNVRFLGGPPCHLVLDLRLRLDGENGPLPVRENPSTLTIEGDLPEDGHVADIGSAHPTGKLIWSWMLLGVCDLRPPPQTVTVRVTSGQGASVTAAEPLAQLLHLRQDLACTGGGQPPGLRPWS
jgi:RNA polymerase sigma-70 factor (sigma-E family)